MVELVVNDIKEYFNYIKEIYLKNFDKILTEDTKKKILNFSYEVIEYDLDLDYHIKVTDKIYYQLDVDGFIESNNLLEENFTELRKNEQEKIKYLLQYKDDKMKIIKDNMLENMILLFIPKKNVFAYGACTFIANQFSKKYNLVSMNTYDKEAEVISKLCDILGEKQLLKAIINGDIKLIENAYDQYCKENEKFKIIFSSFENEFNHYYKNRNKLYYIDVLYHYGNLDYGKIIKQITKLTKRKEQIEHAISLRINSILDCVKELERYMILLKEVDKNNLYYSSLNIKRLLEKNDNTLYFDDILGIEKELKNIVNYIWSYYVNFEGEYDNSSNYWFLIQNYNQLTDDDIQVMHLITNEHLIVPQTKNRFKYGFIYKINMNAVIYSAPDSIIYRKVDESNYQPNLNTYIYNNKTLEIEEQIYSSLLTPRNLLFKTLQNNKEYNDVLVDKNNVYKKAVYCICKNENDPDYGKAYELATKYELPLIPLYESNNVPR